MKALKTGRVQAVYPLTEQALEIVERDDSRDRLNTKLPACAGAAILAMAQYVLYFYIEELRRVGGEVLYCDTDSVVFACTPPQTAQLRRHIHASEFGKLKWELPEDTIEGFVGVAAN